MMTKSFREKVAGAMLAGLVSVILSCVGAYMTVSRAQTNHETRLTTVEASQKDDRANNKQDLRESEQRIRQDLTEIKSDLKEIRNWQQRIAERMADRK
jgi:uncharacterized protein HemX